MDRRITKTKRAIYQAFVQLLNENGYEAMTVQDIIDRADVGRSTFYAHYESKEMLLDELCQELFHHIFREHPEATGIEGIVQHIMQHFEENEDKVASLLLSNNPMFLRQLEHEISHHIYPLLWEEYLIGKRDLPQDFLENFVVTSLIETVTWWLHQRKRPSAQDITHYYLRILK